MLLILGACSGLPPTAGPRPLRDYRGIIHCHSLYSHDSKGTYEEILAAAKAAKVDFICMTDHPPKGDHGLSLREGWTGIHDGVLFIQGAEYSDQILALGIHDPISGKDRRQTIQAIHEQGGVAIACHPEEIDDWDAFEGADGMEIYNVHATLKRKAKEKAFLLQVAKMLKEDPEHSFQLLQELDPEILRKWDEITLRRRFTGIAGNDAHQNVSFFGFQLDPYPRAFRFVTTHVYAEDLTQTAVLEALKSGRCSIVFELLGSPDHYSFGAGEGCPAKEEALRNRIVSGAAMDVAAPGDRIGISLARDLPSMMELVHVGEPAASPSLEASPKSRGVENVFAISCFEVPAGTYRVMVHRQAGERVLPWIVSNPVYVRLRRP